MLARSRAAFQVVSDDEGDVFGAYITCRPQVSEGFLGTGRSWVFSVQEKTIKVFRWSGRNDYFFKGQHNCLIIGAHDGRFGIYIDGDLNNGYACAVGKPSDNRGR